MMARARSGVLAVGLCCTLFSACGKEAPKSGGGSLQPIAEKGLRSPQPGVGEDPPSRTAPDTRDPSQAGEASPAAAAPGSIEIAVGMSRDEFEERTRGCVDRTLFIPGSKTRKLVEVFQTKPGDCVKRLGERRFTLVQLRVEGIEAGLVPEATNAPAPPDDR